MSWWKLRSNLAPLCLIMLSAACGGGLPGGPFDASPSGDIDMAPHGDHGTAAPTAPPSIAALPLFIAPTQLERKKCPTSPELGSSFTAALARAFSEAGMQVVSDENAPHELRAQPGMCKRPNGEVRAWLSLNGGGKSFGKWQESWETKKPLPPEMMMFLDDDRARPVRHNLLAQVAAPSAEDKRRRTMELLNQMMGDEAAAQAAGAGASSQGELEAAAARMVSSVLEAPALLAFANERAGSSTPPTATAANTPGATPSGPAAAINPSEPRFALVIGNGNYKTSPLANPPGDAKMIAASLRTVGFDVTELIDADQKKMRLAIEAFGSKLTRGGVGLFYFAGHGMQVRGRNYLIPVGANINREGEVDIESVDVTRVLSKMDAAKNRINIVVLDACRNNPFARSFRSGNRGLAVMQAPQGTLVAYATSPGSVAADGKGANSPYSTALAKHLKSPDEPIERVFKAVRRDVQSTTDGQQTPWESSSLTAEFTFVPTK